MTTKEYNNSVEIMEDFINEIKDREHNYNEGWNLNIDLEHEIEECKRQEIGMFKELIFDKDEFLKDQNCDSCDEWINGIVEKWDNF